MIVHSLSEAPQSIVAAENRKLGRRFAFGRAAAARPGNYKHAHRDNYSVADALYVCDWLNDREQGYADLAEAIRRADRNVPKTATTTSRRISQ